MEFFACFSVTNGWCSHWQEIKKLLHYPPLRMHVKKLLHYPSQNACMQMMVDQDPEQ